RGRVGGRGRFASHRGQPGGRGVAPPPCGSGRGRIAADVRRRVGVDGEPVCALPGLQACARGSRRVQRQVHVQPVPAARRELRHLSQPYSSDLPQLLPARRHLAVHRCAAGARRRVEGGHLSTRPQERLGDLMRGREEEKLLAEIREGLSRPQKELPSKLFYDERGSELFEEITRLPEYYLTRTEQALLEEHVPRWVDALRPRSLVELGAGSAAKTRVILDAIRAYDHGTYVPVDISADFLERTATELREEYPGLEVVPVASDFTRELALPESLPRPLLLTFLGSTIGNF